MQGWWLLKPRQAALVMQQPPWHAMTDPHVHSFANRDNLPPDNLESVYPLHGFAPHLCGGPGPASVFPTAPLSRQAMQGNTQEGNLGNILVTNGELQQFYAAYERLAVDIFQ